MNHKVALITGGSRGIGFGIAKSLAKEGFALAINGMRNESQLGDTLSSLRSLGVPVMYCQGNVGSAADRASFMQQIKTKWGKLNVLVNNAGVAPKVREDVLEMTEESYDRVMNINLKGAFFLSQAAAKWMLDQQKEKADFKACIINISSISATIASINRGEYCISKAGMSMLSQLLAIRLGGEGIAVYEIRPGIIQTDMTSAVQEKYDKLLAEGLSVQPRWGLPEDVGKAAAALVRGEMLYSTGQVIMVDGGLSIPRL